MYLNPNDNCLYVEARDLEKFGVKLATFNKAVSVANTRRSKGKASQFYLTIKSPLTGRTLVKYNSLSPSYFNTYNLPSEDHLKENVCLESAETTTEAITGQKSAFETALKECLNNRYHKYFPLYFKKFNGHRPRAKQHAQRHSIFELFLEVQKNESRESLKAAFSIYLKLYPHAPQRNFRVFEEKLKNIDHFDIESHLIHKHFGQASNRQKTSDAHLGILNALYADPHKYTAFQIYKTFIAECKQKGLPELKFPTVKKIMADPEFKNRNFEFRHGAKKANDVLFSYMPRQKALYPADQWQVDGTPIQFACINHNGKVIRLNLLAALDVYSGKIVGFDLSESEDRFSYLNTFKNAIALHGHAPAEIVTDNAAPTKTTEFQQFINTLSVVGTIHRFARVGNSQDKGNVERLFRTLQNMARMIDGYLGASPTAKGIDERANPDFYKLFFDKGLPGIDEMKRRIIELINQYNTCENVNGVICSEMYTHEKPNMRAVDHTQMALLFWNVKEIKVARSMVKMTIQKQDYSFEIYDNDLKNKLNGTTVRCRYDESDLSSIMVFDAASDAFICECRANYRPHQAQINQTEIDKEKILQYEAKKKSHRIHNQRKTQEIIDKASVQLGEELVVSNPLSIYKNEANESEFNELAQIMAIQSNVDIKNTKEFTASEVKTNLNRQQKSINKALNDKIFKSKPSLKPYNPSEDTE